jgi:sugar phosphate isomerase/epimerase
LKLAFSTLGCPQWTLERIAETARNLGYQAIELRALGGSINLLERPELQPDAIEETRALLLDQNLSICCVDTSCSFDAIDQRTRQENVEIALKHCAIAKGLGAPLIRVFPNEIPRGATRAETRDRIATSLRELSARAPSGILVGLETHGDFATGLAVAEIVRLAGQSNLAIIWDVANSFAAGDSIAAAGSAVTSYLAHVHLRDARPKTNEALWQPVLAGQGQVPFRQVIETLRTMNYEGYVSFEWEKHWHPEIEEPEVALPDFMAAMQRIRNQEIVAGGEERAENKEMLHDDGIQRQTTHN